MHPEKAKLSIEVSEKVDKIRSWSDITKQDIGSSDTKNKTKITKEAATKTQNKAKENGNNKGLGKTDKNTKQWSI
ncbi:hypothetical protein [Rickettsia tamurae]|uniref:hypothetical protein n=1 Tax=Rickettsia tamurae TaxID=334545 RepID=UPI00050A240E|nr:hypothetical protein [Rickettsia tamurae]